MGLDVLILLLTRLGMLVQVTGPVDAPRVGRLGVEVHSQRYKEIEEGSLDVPVVRAPGTQLLLCLQTCYL